MIPYLKKLTITLYSQILPTHGYTLPLCLRVCPSFPASFPDFQSCRLSPARSSQMCHINSTAAVPINVHRHSLRTLVLNVFSPLLHCMRACLFGEGEAAVGPPRPSKTMATAVCVCVCGESKAADSLIRGGVFNGQLSLPFTTCQPEKNFIIPSPHRSVFFLQHCSGHFSHYITITIHFPDLVRLIRILKYII